MACSGHSKLNILATREIGIFSPNSNGLSRLRSSTYNRVCAHQRDHTRSFRSSYNTMRFTHIRCTTGYGIIHLFMRCSLIHFWPGYLEQVFDLLATIADDSVDFRRAAEVAVYLTLKNTSFAQAAEKIGAPWPVCVIRILLTLKLTWSAK